MKTSRLWIAPVMFAAATSVSALVTVTHTNNTGGRTLDIGETFEVQIDIDYDGSLSNGFGLTGIFTSAKWDPSVLSLLGATTGPFSILCGPAGCLSLLAHPENFPGDPANTLRTVQYGTSPGQFASAGSATITILTFQVIGSGSGLVEPTLLEYDGLTDNSYATRPPPDPDLKLNGTAVNIVPEPSAALLIGLGLVGLSRIQRAGAPAQN